MSSEQLVFVITHTSEKALRQKLLAFHGLFTENKCSGSLIEEVFVRSLDMESSYGESIEWASGSHNSGPDIVINKPVRITLSVKSGTIQGNILLVSGHRMTTAKGDLNKINDILGSNVSDVVVCFVYSKANKSYQIVYVDATVFVYPNLASMWESKMSEKTGKIVRYIWTAPNGLVAEVTPSMSWQVWWKIPMTLCRNGSLIKVT